MSTMRRPREFEFFQSKRAGRPTPLSATCQLHSLVLAVQANPDLSASAFGEGVFERVGDQLIENQAAGYGLIDIQQDGVQLNPDVAGTAAVGRKKIARQGGGILAEIQLIRVFAAVPLSVN